VGHGVDPELCAELIDAAAEFFSRPEAEKARVAMAHGGQAWRGWFGVGSELTSGRPDVKEGLYLGTDDGPSDRPLHGSNQWPEQPAQLRPIVERYLAQVTAAGQHVLAGMALGLGLDAEWFRAGLTADPLVLFRLFHYPPATDSWGVGEHSDYGLLTLLLQDDVGGLEVRGPDGWTDAPSVPGSFVCNLGDMLDRMTGGRYRSTAHRVVNRSGRDRYSFPLFLDPGWDAAVAPIELSGEAPPDDVARRWDGTSLRDISGTYGQYLLAKVAKVFPDLFADAVGSDGVRPSGGPSGPL
jgi:isopenicillin N synthase-like dioxygenase